MDNIRGMINQCIDPNDRLTRSSNQTLLKLQHQDHLEFVVNHKTLLHLVFTVASYIIILVEFSSGVEEA